MPQRGAAALEFMLVMAVLLSVAALVADAARWQVTRQVAHLALMEAARAGSTGHADPTRIRDAFLRALRPLHAGPQGETAGRRLAHSQERIAARMGSVPWRIEILQPDIFRANTLRLRLTYLYQPLLPPLRTLLAGLAENDGSYAAAARARGLAPISIELEMEMHSEPVDWLAGPPYPAGVVQGVCRGLRCP
ncbi:pilus assembly protein [Achromobacter xylosoxidans]|uniref:TadE/TadG family type IV pilus assembly protein n=1 Tax=Achromobacter TaxID=222 RepID=UPI0011DC8975|nr:TadE family protein [Achromobacter xylosoxidans]MCM2569460.1 pilus assembly protein [Achromobacter xylosoxidans]